jgi:glycosyltransferase involved in cell wall biosynthesis
MRIIIDMQGAQTTGSRKRGIGRYTFSLAQALVRQRGEHEIVLVLNGAFPDAVDWLRAEFDGALAPGQIRVWQAPGPIDAMKPANAWRRDSAELLREAFIASLEPDYVLVTSLFEGLGDDAAASVAKLDNAVPTALVLYDLIPLIQRRIYLSNPIQETWYESKLDSLRRADLLLAISASSRQEAIDHLGFDAAACVNISTAADAHFVPLAVSDAQAQALRARYGLRGRYVMYTGGIDHRKNIDGLVRAYAALPGAVRAGLQLAVVCSIQEHNRADLERLAAQAGLAKGELVLTGFVPEEDLVLLYNLCTVFVFPSWHEGFGLPALEAMSCGRAVIAANTSSLPEVVGRADALFDPHDPASMAARLERVLTDDAFRRELEQHGLRQARQFSWDLTARRALAAIEQAPARRRQPGLAVPLRRPRLAYVSPLPPERSGIADYSAELLPELARHYEIDVVAPQATVADPWVKANCQVRSVDWFREHAGRYDRVLYHVGNSAFHSHMFGLMEEIPGVVVLHDFFLSGVAARLESTGAEPGFWTAALYDSHGYPALARRFADPVPEVVAAYPCNLPVLRAALNVIVHSDNSLRLARDWYGPAAADGWHLVPHLRSAAPPAPRHQARQALGLGQDSLVVCSFGLLGPNKLNERLLSAWLATLADDPDCILVFVGENAAGEYGADLLAAIAASPARARIRITGWADTDLYRQYLAAADVGVQLRANSRGETSGTVLDCMNYGLATIVNAHGSLADLPDDAVLKLPDAFRDEQLQAALLRMRDDPAERQRLGRRGRERILTAHAPRHCADQYAQAIEQAYHDAARGPVALVDAVAQLEAGPASEQDLVRFAQALAQCLPPRIRLRQRLIEVDPAQRLPDGAAAELARLLRMPSRDERVEPVYVDKDGLVRYARSVALPLLGGAAQALPDEVADCHHGDSLVALPHAGGQVRADALKNLQRRGVGLLSPMAQANTSTGKPS